MFLLRGLQWCWEKICKTFQAFFFSFSCTFDTPHAWKRGNIRVTHDGSNTINCCLNSLQEMSGSRYLSICGEQRDTMKKALTAPVVSVVHVHGVFFWPQNALWMGQEMKKICYLLQKRGWGWGGAAGQSAVPKEGGFHTQLCYPSPGLSLAKSLHISPSISLLISKWNKDTSLKCFETYSAKIISKTMSGLKW